MKIIIKVNKCFFRVLMDFPPPTKMFKVCSGPGCKAWDCEKFLDLIRESMNQPNESKETRVFPVACMNKCGGGVSVEMLPSKKSVKLREPNEIFKVLNLTQGM